jgi:hypothetical protein
MRPLLVRFGLCALGLVYVAMGIASARVAWLGAREREQGVGGALRVLFAQGKGSWLLAAGGRARRARGRADARRVPGKRSVISRSGLVIDGLGYAVLCWTAVALLLHLRRGGPHPDEDGATWLLSESWARRSSRSPDRRRGRRAPRALDGSQRTAHASARRRAQDDREGADRIARFGLAARGAVLCAIGYYIIRAAEEVNPSRVHTMGGTLKQVYVTPYGAVIVGVLAFRSRGVRDPPRRAGAREAEGVSAQLIPSHCRSCFISASAAGGPGSRGRRAC